MRTQWEDYESLLCPPLEGDDDDDRRSRKEEMRRALKDDWLRYMATTHTTVTKLSHVADFWKSWCVLREGHQNHPSACRSGPLGEAVLPWLWYPVTSAAVERSFSLAGLIDTKNRTRMSKDLRQAAVMLFCNGDKEGRFTTTCP